MSVNSASGPAWTPLAVVTATRSTAGPVELERLGHLLAAAGVARLHPAERRAASHRVDQALRRRAGDAEQDLGAPEQLGPAGGFGREVARDVPHVARRRDDRGVVEQLDALVLAGDAVRELLGERAGDEDGRHRRILPRRLPGSPKGGGGRDAWAAAGDDVDFAADVVRLAEVGSRSHR